MPYGMTVWAIWFAGECQGGAGTRQTAWRVNIQQRTSNVEQGSPFDAPAKQRGG